ncbi:restriction endonuclease subunit S [Staphylococcus aureus]|uniref:restriction endonuclease subunit S n=1 Tax=Staphylococcus aureus TaxID=1280 RepID=UPI00397D1B91
MSNTQKKNVPELRFPGFEGEWEEKKFADFTKINQGLQIAINERKTEYSPELYFYITNEFLRPNSQTKYFIENPPKSVIANKEDILMTRTGNTGKVVTNVFGAFHNNFFKIKFDKNLYDRLFLVEVLNSSKIQNKILSLAGSSTIPDLNHSDFYSISSSYPLLREQQKIGQFFSKLDRQIELEEQKLELLQQQKKGYMQKIFSQELRFKDENGNDYPDWEEKKIEDIASQVYGGGTPNTKIKEFWNGDIPWIQSSDVKVNDLILQQCNKFISKNSIELSSAKLIPANSIAIVTRVGVGKLCLVEFDYATSQDFLSLSSLKYDKLYSLYSLLYTMKKISANLQGTSIKGITKKELLDSIIKIPHNLEEQQKIGELFYKIDKYISFNKCKIEMLKSLKQGLLQKMFI